MLSFSLISIALAMTRVRFGGGADVWADPADWAALGGAALLEVDGAPGAEFGPAAEEELRKWSEQPAVQQVWQTSYKLFDYRSTPQANAVANMMTKIVPGLTVSFSEVFDAFAAGGCPVWLIGGTVRDLIAEKKPNDVDTAILCDTRIVKRICTRKGWKHDPEDHAAEPYFSVGIAHGDDEEYLEGFSIDLVMKDPFTPETSVNMLFWSMSSNFVVDPSGLGVQDAQQQILRPAAPPKEMVAAASTTWQTWRQWILGSFSGPQHQRHNRYLKMRMRGWQPVEDTLSQPLGMCFRFFMANQMATLLPLELQQPESVIDPRTMMTLHGDQQPMVPGATLVFLQEKLPKMDEPEKAVYVRKFFTVLLEDLDPYYNEPSSSYLTCSQGGRVAKEGRRVGEHGPARVAANSLDLIRDTLVKGCVAPPLHYIVEANPQMFAPPEMRGQALPETDYAGACRHFLDAFNEHTGEAHVPSDFRLPGHGGRQSQAGLDVRGAQLPALLPYLRTAWHHAPMPALMNPPQVVQLVAPPARHFVAQPIHFVAPPIFVDRFGRSSVMPPAPTLLTRVHVPSGGHPSMVRADRPLVGGMMPPAPVLLPRMGAPPMGGMMPPMHPMGAPPMGGMMPPMGGHVRRF